MIVSPYIFFQLHVSEDRQGWVCLLEFKKSTIGVHLHFSDCLDTVRSPIDAPKGQCSSLHRYPADQSCQTDLRLKEALFYLLGR